MMNKDSKPTDFKVFLLFLKRLSRMCPRLIISLFLQKLASSIRDLLILFIPKILIDLISKKADTDEFIKWAVIFIVISGFLYLADNFLNKLLSEDRIKLSDKARAILSKKIMTLKYSYLENPECLNLKEHAQWGLINYGAIEMFIINSGNIIESLIVITTSAVLIFRLSPLILLTAVILQVVSIFAVTKITAVRNKVMTNLVPINRKYGVMLENVRKRENQMDIKIYDTVKLQVDGLFRYNREMTKEFIAMYDSFISGYSLMQVTGFLISGITMFYAGVRAAGTDFGSRISLGDFSVFAGAALKFSQRVKIIIESSAELTYALQMLKPFEELMALLGESESGKVPSPDESPEVIEFKNVTFRYPGTEKDILKNVSFKINKNEKISIVGLNGAGKTTLIKLLCRFFSPDTGEILINGRNISEYDYGSYNSMIACVFQDFKIFNLSVLDNIIGADEDTESNRIKALETAEGTGLTEKLTSLPHGIDTLIGKDYYKEGTDMSGGQLQKIAISRALYKNSPIIILDEPTSALDPLAEAEIYENFSRLTKNRTSIYISHRMSSSVFCDRILLLNNGETEAFDSHKNLMKNKEGLYYKMFTAQSENYVTK